MKHILEVRCQMSDVRKSKQLISFCLSSGIRRLFPFFCFLFSVLCFLSSAPCYAQTTEPNLQLDYKSDLLVDDTSFEYYKIIEQRNFFRPKKNISDSQSISEQESKPTSKTSKKDGLDFLLTGVIEIKSGYKAIVEQKSTKKGFYVSINEAIENYTVKEIMLDKIIIEKDGKEFELKLQQGSKKNNKDTNTPAKNNVSTEQKIDINNNISSPKTLRENTIQQIRSGTRGSK